ncbi:MAG: biotin/lipoyl-containing protein [Phycisphaeraceae bacterium]
MKLRITVQGVAYDVDVQVLDAGETDGGVVTSTAPPSTADEASAAPAAPPAAAQDVTAPLAGAVAAIPVSVGDVVAAGDTVAVLEAMKMESNIDAPGPGTVKEIRVKVGDNVTQGQVLVRLG